MKSTYKKIKINVAVLIDGILQKVNSENLRTLEVNKTVDLRKEIFA